MGIQVEFNPDLALRNIEEFKTAGRRDPRECIPENLRPGTVHEFLKVGQRLYWLDGEIPLVETQGEGKLSRPKASIRIIEATHYTVGSGKVWTKGLYKVVEVFTDNKVHFDGFARVRN